MPSNIIHVFIYNHRRGWPKSKWFIYDEDEIANKNNNKELARTFRHRPRCRRDIIT